MTSEFCSKCGKQHNKHQIICSCGNLFLYETGFDIRLRLYDIVPKEEILNLREEFNIFRREKVRFRDKKVNIDKHLQIYKNNPRCVSCGLEGTQFVLFYPIKPLRALKKVFCSADFNIMSIDHIIAKSRGGLDEFENFQTMCRRCNNYKDSKSNEEFMLKGIKNVKLE